MAEDLKDPVQSFLDMSDEDMANVDVAAVSRQASEAAAETVVDTDTNAGVVDAGVADTGGTDDDDDAAAAAVVDTGTNDEGTADGHAEQADKSAGSDVDAGAAETDATAPKPDAGKEPEATVDYKAAYERLIAPFKANGREIAVASVDDAIALMQMGANYNKKMAALKPNLKMLKLLENNGLLNEDKLSFLIELDKKNPEAIGKLVKDSGVDPLDIPTDAAKDYVPKKHTVEDVEMELDAVLDEIQDTPTYTRTLNLVSKEWDGPSKQTVANSPQILKVINSHMQSGIYDLIQTEMERERMFGRLTGLSDIEAYRQVGDAIQARGGFDHLGHQGKQTPPPVVVAPKPKVADDDKLKDKKRAASSTKPAGSSAAAAEFNPLALSDEEFSKQVNGRYL